MATRFWSVVIDANDPAALGTFWAQVLGWQLKEGEGYTSVTAGEGFLPRLEFVPVPEPKTSKNRIHFDLRSDSKEQQDETVARLIDLGAKRVDIGQGDDVPWVVLADLEGNEFCVSPPGFPAGTGPIGAIAYDANDHDALGRFWSAATGWPIVHRTDDVSFLRSPNTSGPFMTVAGPPERVASKPVKNRLHIDVAPFRIDNQEMEVEGLIALGARRIDIGQGDVPWVVLADPEGNEFCVLTPL